MAVKVCFHWSLNYKLNLHQLKVHHITSESCTVVDISILTDDLKRQPSLPTDVMENINSMQSTVEQLLADMSLVSVISVIVLM